MAATTATKTAKRGRPSKPDEWRVTVNVRGEIHLELRALCDARGLKISSAVDDALADYIAAAKRLHAS